MDAFSYLSVLNSIVLGLGGPSLLAGVAAMVRARDRIKMYWPLPAQMALLFLIQVQLWWALFALRERGTWNFLAFLVVLMQPVLVYLATAFLVPDIPDGATKRWISGTPIFVRRAGSSRLLSSCCSTAWRRASC